MELNRSTVWEKKYRQRNRERDRVGLIKYNNHNASFEKNNKNANIINISFILCLSLSSIRNKQCMFINHICIYELYIWMTYEPHTIVYFDNRQIFHCYTISSIEAQIRVRERLRAVPCSSVSTVSRTRRFIFPSTNRSNAHLMCGVVHRQNGLIFNYFDKHQISDRYVHWGTELCVCISTDKIRQWILLSLICWLWLTHAHNRIYEYLNILI